MNDFTLAAKQVNNQSPYCNNNYFDQQRRRAYAGERERFKLVEKICDDKSASPGIRLLLTELIKSSNANNEVVSSQASFAAKLHVSLSAIKRYFKLIKEWGWIKSERRGNSWAERETNKITLLFLQNESPTVSVKMNHDINNLNTLRDLNNNITYDDYVSVSANLEKKGKPAPKTRPKTHIDETKLKTDPDAEIKRACLARGLSKDVEAYVRKAMNQSRDIKQPAAFLAGILKNCSNDMIVNVDETPNTKLSDETERGIEAQADRFADEYMAANGHIEPTCTPGSNDWLLKLRDYNDLRTTVFLQKRAQLIEEAKITLLPKTIH